MPKIPAILLFCFLFSSVLAQDDPGIWTGGGLYKPGESIGDLLKSIGGEKKIVIQVGPHGEITGTLDVTYNKAIAARPNDAADVSFLIGGRYDSTKNKLLLVVTHVRAPTSATVDKQFKYPDSLYYTVQVNRQQGFVAMTGFADVLSEGLVAEWLSSNKISAQVLHLSGKLNMHILPLNIRLEKFISVTDAPVAVVVAPVTAAVPPAKKEPLAVAPQIDKRKTEIQSTINLDTSLIKLDLYDNGEVDGDIATLILDGNVIINNQLLGTKAVSVTINLSYDKPEHLLELYAINEGSIPPNAALVVLTCNRKRYEITLSSNGTQNGSVKLVLRRK